MTATNKGLLIVATFCFIPLFLLPIVGIGPASQVAGCILAGLLAFLLYLIVRNRKSLERAKAEAVAQIYAAIEAEIVTTLKAKEVAGEAMLKAKYGMRHRFKVYVSGEIRPIVRVESDTTLRAHYIRYGFSDLSTTYSPANIRKIVVVEDTAGMKLYEAAREAYHIADKAHVKATRQKYEAMW